ncbi:ribbon-helix-helix protein, CopG family [Methanofollis formosanus]|uniref:Ribbon-helix-helix protein, CopG family n=1 Tax=Methanofollis formosanus TaxID=299308 RepID=A0A8G1A2F3_9EURY|nr:ribbon-helix-helix protein, CopG family [Methanofollis formosanus]QYZ80134.1 ribbon-helix-helix protein, CopG family [Methanofollis formosanus]
MMDRYDSVSVSMDDNLVARVDDAVAREGAASRSAWLGRVAAEQGKLVEEVAHLRDAAI